MDDGWVEFSKVVVAHALAVASPGPDFAIVLRQSLQHGRPAAVWTALGIGVAILLHVTYSLLGLGLLIRGSETWFNAVKYAGAAYLVWLGVQSLRTRPRADLGPGPVAEAAAPGPGAAFAAGFVTNALNPKATLALLSLFAVIVSPATPKLVQAGYGAYMAVATAVWFTLVALVFTRDDVRRRFLRHGHWIDRTLGVVFLGLAISLFLARAG